VNPARALGYQRLMEADGRLSAWRERHGCADRTLAALVTSDQLEGEDDLYLSTLAGYIASLGGRVEVRAVFGEEAVTVLALPVAG
jgi:hypothetical protein